MTSYKRIDFDAAGDLSLFKEFYDGVYVKAFENEDERETADNIIKQHKLFQKYKESKGIGYYCIAAVQEGHAVGGIIADVFAACGSCAMEFIAVSEKCRKSGVGDGLIDYFHKCVEADYGKGAIIYCFFEAENPALMPEAEYDFCMNRIRHWEKRGAKRIDIDYVQPALSKGKNDVSNLFLCCFMKEGDLTLPKTVIRQFLEHFFRYAISVPAQEARKKINAVLSQKNEDIAVLGPVESVNSIVGTRMRAIGDFYTQRKSADKKHITQRSENAASPLFEVQVSADNPGSVKIFEKFYNGIFVDAFPDENERGSFEEYLQYFRQYSGESPNDFRVDVIVDKYNTPAAGIVYAVYGEIKSVAVLFIVVAREYRGRGLASGMLDSLAKKTAEAKGFKPEWLFAEIPKDDGSADAQKSRSFWRKNAVKKIDIPYIQPPLPDRQPLDIFDLGVKKYGDPASKINTKTAERFLDLYTETAIMPEGLCRNPIHLENIKALRQKGAFVSLADI